MASNESDDEYPEIIFETQRNNAAESGNNNGEVEMETADSGLGSGDSESTTPDNPGEENNKPNSLENNDNADKETPYIFSVKCLHGVRFSDKQPECKGDLVRGAAGFSQSSVPARNNWKGVHNFTIKIQCNDQPKKSDSTVFSKELKKLYVDRDVPFKVLVSAENVPRGSRIQVTADFIDLEHSYEVVQRCPTHSQIDSSKGVPAYNHFIQCYSDTAVYKKDPVTGKCSVSVPYEMPREGEMYTAYLFKLTCFSSCLGGLNRRPFMLIFTLEYCNAPVGRQIIKAKVCACPSRDLNGEQERGGGKRARTKPVIKPPSDGKTRKQTYTIAVRDPELFHFLDQMKSLFEFAKMQKD